MMENLINKQIIVTKKLNKGILSLTNTVQNNYRLLNSPSKFGKSASYSSHPVHVESSCVYRIYKSFTSTC